MSLWGNSPWLQSSHKSWEMIASTPQGHTCPDLLWQPSKAAKIWECWQLWPIVGEVGNGGAEEDWCWDLNPGVAAMWGLFGTMWLGQRRTMDFYSFFWDTVPQTGQRGKEGLWVCGHSKGLWDLNEDIKSLLLSLYSSKLIITFLSPVSGIERCLSLVAGKANIVQGGRTPGAQGWVHSVIVYCSPPPTPSVL